MGKLGWWVAAIVMCTALVWARGLNSAADPLCAALQQALVAGNGGEQ